VLTEVEQPLRQRVGLHEVEDGLGGGELPRGRVGVTGERCGSSPQIRDERLPIGARAELEYELTTRGAQGRVDPGEHPSEAARGVGRQQPQPLRIAVGAEVGESPFERLPAEHRALRLVQLAERRVEPCFERVRSEHAQAETVDRRDPGSVERPREIRSAVVAQPRPDPASQLRRGLPRVGDQEDGLDVDAPVADRTHVALDDDRRLAGAGSGRHEDLTGRLDRSPLLGVEGHRRHPRRTLHIVQRSHHDGQSPPLGSWLTSPARIRRA
jgi:hypothetical protein